MDEYLLNQIKSKTLPIAKVLYSEYKLLFVFDNVTNYAIYAKDKLQVININKDPENKSFFL